MTQLKPNISKKAFWDVNFEDIDFERNQIFIIDKVFNYGGFQDQLEVIRFYGKEKISQDILKVPFFRKEVFAFVCGYFQLDPANFQCYLKRQSNPSHWEY